MLSLYRLLSVPFALLFTFQNNEKVTGLLIAVGLITDLLDGIIARVFSQETKLGALLDSWADLGIFICSIFAIAKFKWNDIALHAQWFYLFIFLLVLSYLVVFIKFRRLIGLHTYFFKLTGYLQGLFIVLLFMVKFYPVLFIIAMAAGSIACIEEIIIIAILKYPQMNVKGLYWVLKEKKYND